jgi:broad specificity phosphatase PhoE
VTVIFLIRHGETDWLGKRLAGCLPGIHLNEKGRAQAEALTRSFASVPVVAVYSSPLERALETAEPVARASGQRIVREDALLEVDFGSLVGKAYPDLRGNRSWKEVRQNPLEARYPGGESLPEVQVRIVTVLRQIAVRHPGGAVLLFSHSDTIRLGLAFFLGIPLSGFQTLVIDTASISSLYRKGDLTRIVGLNLPAGIPIPWKGEE